MAEEATAGLPMGGMDRRSPVSSASPHVVLERSNSKRPRSSPTRAIAEAKWTRKDVVDHFEEAVRTLRKLPPVRVTGYFSAWPEVLRSAKEIAAMEPEPMRVRPGADAITRLEQTSDWMLWINIDERKLIWLRAARVPWKTITWELGCDRTTAWRRWTFALNKITARLNAQ